MAVSSLADAPTSERLRLVRPLGVNGTRTWAAVESLGDGKTRVVVVEKVERGGGHGDAEIADWLRDVRRLATLEHPNLARVRDVSIRGDEVLVTGDFIDGARWSELGAASARPALETALRVLVDVLSALGAMHNLRDEKREPVKLVHGSLTPDCVIVGLDGMARLVLPCRVRADGLQSDRTGSAYLAPEILLGDESADARADVYGVGAMLWEALSGKTLFAGLPPSAIVTQLLSGRVPKASVPEGSPWAAPLVEAAGRAMSADPEKRFASAAAMAAEIRRIAGAKLPPAMRVAAYVRGAHGDRIRARRQEIEQGEARAPVDSEALPAIDVDFEVDAVGRATAVPDPEATHTSTTRPPPPIEPPPPVLAPAPPLPRAPPPLRPRHATLAGVAPPVAPTEENTGPGTPVVVPSSRPPPPLASDPSPIAAQPDLPPGPPPLPPVVTPFSAPVSAPIEVPRLAPVPADLVRDVALETRVAPPEPPPLSPVPAMPPMVTPLDEPPPPIPAPRRKVPVALVGVAFALFGLAAVVWWLALRGPQRADAAPVPSASLTAVAAMPPPPPAPTPAMTATEAPTTSQEPEAPPASATTTTTAAASDVPAAGASTAPVVTASPVTAPAAPARPPAQRPRYEPEGI